MFYKNSERMEKSIDDGRWSMAVVRYFGRYCSSPVQSVLRLPPCYVLHERRPVGINLFR
jgi:hypothetical protein